METRARFALIGAFTLAIFAGAFGFVIWFSGSGKPSNLIAYRLVFTSSVSGLSRGAPVLFNGLRVGEVKAIDLGDDPSQVFAQIEVDRRTPVKTDTKARLEYQGLTGAAAVALSGGSAAAPRLATREDGGPSTIIAESSEFQNILQSLQGLSAKLDGVLDKADHLLADNQQALSNTARNIEAFSQALADSSGEITQVMTGLSDASRAIRPFFDALSRNSGDVDAILDNAKGLTAKLNAAADKVGGVLDGAQAFLGTPGSKSTFDDVGDAARSIKRLADNLDVRTRDIASGLKSFTGGGLKQYEALAADGRKTLDTINKTVESLKNDPQQIIFGAKKKTP